MRTALKVAEIVLWAVGAVSITVLVAIHGEAARTRVASQHLRMHSGPLSEEMLSKLPQEASSQGSLLGRLDIPALHLTTPIIDDDDSASLLRGAGHIRGTAMPGGLGNFVIAAHRDTYFRPLSGIKAGMAMQVVTRSETYTYVVDSFKVVNPEDVYVLDTGDVPQMTLITCYPFHYIGAAPQRFTVTAHLAAF